MISRVINLVKILGKKNSILMLGARGTGKTFLTKELIKGRSDAQRIDLLKFDVYQRYLNDPGVLGKEIEEMLKQQEHLLLVIDEIQRVPNLLDEVHSAIEDYKGRIQFILTGSSARKLKRGGANLLAGRALLVRLHPLTSEEIEPDFEKTLRFGTLPPAYLDHDTPDLFLKTYFEIYLREEIMQEGFVRKFDTFTRFLEVAGQMHGEIINATQIAKSANVTAKTVQGYYQILEDTLLGFYLHGWSASVRKQLRITPKFYFFDNGVTNAIRGELQVVFTPRTARWGKLFEAWIIQEVFRLNDYHNLGLKMSYWKTNNDLEVDLIISRGISEPIAAIEIKSTILPKTKNFSALNSFHEEYPQVPLFVFAQVPRPYKEGQVSILPWREGLEIIKKLSSVSLES